MMRLLRWLGAPLRRAWRWLGGSRVVARGGPYVARTLTFKERRRRSRELVTALGLHLHDEGWRCHLCREPTLAIRGTVVKRSLAGEAFTFLAHTERGYLCARCETVSKYSDGSGAEVHVDTWAGEARREDGFPLVTMVTCEVCAYAYQTGDGWWRDCPRCHPEQPEPLERRLVDEKASMGAEYAWMPWRGPRGRWVHRRELLVLDIDVLEEIRDVGAALEGLVALEEKILPAAAREIRRLRAEAKAKER